MRTADGYIVSRCINGDSAAFGLLVDRYKEGVYALAYSKLRNFHDAEDVTQEVFIKAYSKLRTLRRWDNFHAWIYSITSNVCKDWIRAQSRRPEKTFAEDQTAKVMGETKENSPHEGPLEEMLHETLDSLSEVHRQVLTLYYLSDMNSQEIGEFLGMSSAAVRQRLSRARSQLKERMFAMMGTAFEGRKLQAGFTLRIVEAIKRMPIPATPRTSGLPLGLSLATGLVIALLGLNPHLTSVSSVKPPTSGSLPSEMKALKAGEIYVDVLKFSQMPIMASKMENNSNERSELLAPQKAPLLAPENAAWKEKGDMPNARYGMCGVSINGKIYTIGGSADNGSAISAVEEYDPVNDSWTKKADMPTPRYAIATCVVNDRIYAIGGRINSRANLTEMEEYDPATDSWTEKADMPIGKNSMSASLVDGKIYVIGGHNGGTIFKTVEEYDPVTDTWTKKTDMPTIRFAHGASVVDGIIYVVGGSTGGQNNRPLQTVEAYDPATDTWTKKADMPTARNGLMTIAVNGKIHAFGGGKLIFDTLTTVEVYDPATDTWAKEEDMLSPRFGSVTGIVNDKIYFIGGISDYPMTLSSIHEYTPPGLTSTVSPQGKLPTTWGQEKRPLR